MGASAPVFKSTPELSTVQAFAVGTWRETSDPTVKSKSDWIRGFLDAKVYSLLTLTADGKATLKQPGLSTCVGHGTWTAGGDQIGISFTDVDGLNFGEVDAEWEKRLAFERSLGRLQGPDNGVEGARHDVERACESAQNLEIAANGRDLEFVGKRNAAWERDVGRSIWVRVK
jgi:hypothetical protein